MDGRNDNGDRTENQEKDVIVLVDTIKNNTRF